MKHFGICMMNCVSFCQLSSNETYLIFRHLHTKDDQRDPCIGKLCSYGAQCMPSLDGLTARCLCPEHCDTFGDNVGSTPVCGMDGHDYDNSCEMKRVSCREMKDIERKFDGRCDPCDGHECPAGLVCQVDETRQPMCRCSNRCTDEFSPVCGTDGRTYASDCALRVQACRSHRDITVMFRGDCSSGNNPCSKVTCEHHTEECHVDRRGEAKCTCPLRCEKVFRPVCANNSRTYDNDCELRRQSCLSRIRLNILYVGMCDSASPCNIYKCSYGAVCSVVRGRALCQCPTMCPEHYQPVCGSDGVTHGNECKMKSAGCQQQKRITAHSKGQCNGCESIKCNFYSICESDGKSGGKCVCPVTCIQVENKVCGTDGVTYMNECELRVASCRKQQFVVISSYGPCDHCDRIKCSHGAICKNNKCQCQMHCPGAEDLVCASDGVSYVSECAMHRAACQRGITLKVVHLGECEELSSSGSICDEMTCRFGGTCLYDTEGDRGCQCRFYCNAIRSPVCGSDGRSYGNECQMKEESCRRQQEIFALPLESCLDIVEEFCDGSAPLVDASSGKDYHCNSAGERCPAGSYCHKLAAGSKCCMEDQYLKNCEDTMFGCCPDGRTPAPGPTHAGCPSICLCNPLGAYGRTCDPTTRQCTCKPGVGGLRCDRCEPNFWGLPKIAEGNSGCIPCGCNLFGSVRDDCEQTTGRCICRQHVTGQKCNICANGKELGPQGCIEQSAGSCAELECRYNAVCQLNNGVAECICPSSCHTTNLTLTVCGTDGLTYASACHLRLSACRLQKDTLVAHYGPCQELMIPNGSIENVSLLTSSSSSSVPDASHLVAMGYVGDDCYLEKVCLVPDSFCRMSRCTCKEGYSPSANRKSCRKSGFFPSFSGTSYIQLKRLQHGSHEISVEIEFRPFRNTGILLYIGQTEDGRGDFILLCLREGYVEFRYDLGSGPATLTTLERVALNQIQKVTAKRFGKDGLLRLNEGNEISGVSPGSLRSLNLGDPFYLGHIANFTDQIIRNVGTTQGFVGCIESLKIDSSELSNAYDLNRYALSPDIVTRYLTGECGRYPCDNNPCLNGGICVHVDSVDFHCQCPEGFAGFVCQDEVLFAADCHPNPCLAGGTCFGFSPGHFCCICPPERTGAKCEDVFSEGSNHFLSNISIPQFQGTSYLELKLTKNLGRSLAFEIWFLTSSPNGVLLYSGQEGTSKGDFFCLNLVNRYLQLRYNLGSGIANITSAIAVNLHTWIQVSVFRMNQFGSLTINFGVPSRGYSDGDLKELNLPMTLYLGGYPGEYNAQAGVTAGFHGAIQRFYEDGSLVENFVAEAVSYHKITQYSGPPCPTHHNPCLRNSTCRPHLNDFECQCPQHFTGKRCEIALLDVNLSRPMAFDGHVFHRYRNTISRFEKSQATNSYELVFRTNSTQGLILLQHKSGTVHADYLVIAINEGHVEVSLNLGKELATDLLIIRSRSYVVDKNWHTLLFNRDKRLATFQVDTGPSVTILSTPGATQLDTDGCLWIGGSKNVPRGLPEAYYSGFSGCIKYVKINNRTLDLLMDRDSHDRVEFCNSPT